ncbi:DNA-methyltransferase [Tissierella praeacuta]|uniref:DNA-methyltransferase n=1 Tax=Tissierella praeacuta TaxID=43131 RepID=UPI0028AEB43B|nr:site-specific DNA-methyltransferase [Tissierella praeacuta]
MTKTKMMLFKDDCLEVLKTIPKDSVDLIVTDPPYNLGNFMRDRDTNLKQLRSNFFGAAGWDDLEYDEWMKSMDRFFELANNALKKGGSMIIFMSLIKVESIIKLAQRYKFYYKTTGIWHKLNPMPRNMNLHFINSVEGWIYFVNETKTGTYNNNGKAIHDFIETSLTPGSEKRFGTHPTQKPEKVIEHFIEILSNEGETVLDPFMGSGTTGVVSKRLNRNFIGVELEEDYFDIALKRIGEEKSSQEYKFEVIQG